MKKAQWMALLVMHLQPCPTSSLFTNRINTDDEPIPFKCNLYMAPSSIPNAGFGVYTTRDIKRDEPVLPMSDAPTIVATDVLVHAGMDSNEFWTVRKLMIAVLVVS